MWIRQDSTITQQAEGGAGVRGLAQYRAFKRSLWGALYRDSIGIHFTDSCWNTFRVVGELKWYRIKWIKGINYP